MNHTDREEQKEMARRILSEAMTTAQRAYAVRLLIEAYYYRNTDSPSFETYAAHFLYANAQDFPADAVRVLESNFGRPRRPKIQPGYSDWNSYGQPGYLAA